MPANTVNDWMPSATSVVCTFVAVLVIQKIVSIFTEQHKLRQAAEESRLADSLLQGQIKELELQQIEAENLAAVSQASLVFGMTMRRKSKTQALPGFILLLHFA